MRQQLLPLLIQFNEELMGEFMLLPTIVNWEAPMDFDIFSSKRIIDDFGLVRIFGLVSKLFPRKKAENPP